jgi:DNA-binding transcriptional regulator WhiA
VTQNRGKYFSVTFNEKTGDFIWTGTIRHPETSNYLLNISRKSKELLKKSEKNKTSIVWNNKRRGRVKLKKNYLQRLQQYNEAVLLYFLILSWAKT